MTEVTRILVALETDPKAADQLLPLVYEELRRLAEQKLSQEAPGQTLQATDLVHEAYLRLVGPDGQGQEVSWDHRGHFFAAAAEAMRRILVDRARRKGALKRGGAARRVDLDTLDVTCEDKSEELLELDAALTALEGHDPVAARLVNLRFFAGLTHQQAAEALNITRGAADDRWALARAWLYRRLRDAEAGE